MEYLKNADEYICPFHPLSAYSLSEPLQKGADFSLPFTGEGKFRSQVRWSDYKRFRKLPHYTLQSNARELEQIGSVMKSFTTRKSDLLENVRKFLSVFLLHINYFYFVFFVM